MSLPSRNILIWATTVREAESNAFEKSKNIASVGLDLFLDDAHFKILPFQNHELKILAVFKIFAFQNSEFQILTDFTI